MRNGHDPALCVQWGKAVSSLRPNKWILHCCTRDKLGYEVELHTIVSCNRSVLNGIHALFQEHLCAVVLQLATSSSHVVDATAQLTMQLDATSSLHVLTLFGGCATWQTVCSDSCAMSKLRWSVLENLTSTRPTPIGQHRRLGSKRRVLATAGPIASETGGWAHQTCWAPTC